MSDDEPTVIVGSEASSHTGYVVPGSIMVPCAECAKPTYVSPSSFEILTETDTTVICHGCFALRLAAQPDEIKIRKPNAKTIDEIEVWRRQRG